MRVTFSYGTEYMYTTVLPYQWLTGGFYILEPFCVLSFPYLEHSVLTLVLVKCTLGTFCFRSMVQSLCDRSSAIHTCRSCSAWYTFRLHWIIIDVYWVPRTFCSQTHVWKTNVNARNMYWFILLAFPSDTVWPASCFATRVMEPLVQCIFQYIHGFIPQNNSCQLIHAWSCCGHASC